MDRNLKKTCACTASYSCKLGWDNKEKSIVHIYICYICIVPGNSNEDH